jgi:ABC-2 type transport system ATP-binding protein
VTADPAIEELPSSTTSGPAIEVRDLVKLYGDRTALDGVSFRIERGELFALLGPNGAGKTTTVEILEGYRSADRGTVRVLGLDPADRRGRALLRPQVGLMLQEPSLYPLLNARELVRLAAAYYPARHSDDATGGLRADRLLARVGMDDPALLRTPFRRLSRGERQRVSLAVALVGEPALLFLDEPTAGLDPAARTQAEALVRELRAAGVTILLTTHDLAQAERVADRVAIIDRGRIVAMGSPGELTRGASTVRFTAAPGLPVAELGADPGVSAREVGPGEYVVEGVVTPALVASVASWLARRDILAREIRIGAGSLEELFLRLTRDDGE